MKRLVRVPDGPAAPGKRAPCSRCVFAAAAGVANFDVVIVTDGWEVAGVEEGTGVGEFGTLVAVFEATAGVPNVEGHVEFVAGSERRFKLIDGVEGAGAGGDDVEGPVKVDVGDGLLLVGDVDLADGLGGLVLEDKVAIAGEGAALGEDVNVGVDGDDFRSGMFFIPLEVALVGGLDITAGLSGEVLVEDVCVVEVPDAAAGGDEE